MKDGSSIAFLHRTDYFKPHTRKNSKYPIKFRGHQRLNHVHFIWSLIFYNMVTPAKNIPIYLYNLHSQMNINVVHISQ